MSRPVLFEAARLLSRAERGAPTGVDRVCLAYAEHLLARHGPALTPVWTRGERVWGVDPGWFAEQVAELRARWSEDPGKGPLERRLIQALGHPSRRSILNLHGSEVETARARRSATVNRLLRARPLPTRLSDALYINVGHTGLERPGPLERLREAGARPVLMLHDLIPVTHPEYCRPGEGPRHRGRVRAALRLADRLVANSAYTADEIGAFAAWEGLNAPPVHVSHLGLEPAFLQRGWLPTPRPWFIHVGTLEGRKNLAFLLSLWRRIAERRGDEAPGLLLLGRPGWENEAVLDHLERSPPLQGLVHHAAELPDAALARLMRGARALLAPSSVEGFDLPVAEARALGVPVIASDIAAHREVAPDSRLVDPTDGPGWLNAVEDALAGRLKPPPSPGRGWSDHFASLHRALEP